MYKTDLKRCEKPLAETRALLLLPADRRRMDLCSPTFTATCPL